MPAFKIGDRVTWRSQAAGTWRTKVGEVIEFVPAGRRPKACEALARDHDSYVVRAIAQGRATQKPQVYWPRVSALSLAPAAPVVEVERVSYQMTVQVGGRPARSFSGHSTQELERDLRAAGDELGKGGRRG